METNTVPEIKLMVTKGETMRRENKLGTIVLAYTHYYVQNT